MHKTNICPITYDNNFECNLVEIKNPCILSNSRPNTQQQQQSVRTKALVILDRHLKVVQLIGPIK